MGKWKKLDLSRCFDRPSVGQLVALRLAPINSDSPFYNADKYDIGRFAHDAQTGRKLWWHGTHGCHDPIRMKKHYEIWWCPVADFDAFV